MPGCGTGAGEGPPHAGGSADPASSPGFTSTQSHTFYAQCSHRPSPTNAFEFHPNRFDVENNWKDGLVFSNADF